MVGLVVLKGVKLEINSRQIRVLFRSLDCFAGSGNLLEYFE